MNLWVTFVLMDVVITLMRFNIFSAFMAATSFFPVIMMSVRSSKVVVTLALMQDLHLDQVEEQAHNSCYKHFFAFDFLSVCKSVNSLVKQPESHREQEDD